jgi:hypothetical protein
LSESRSEQIQALRDEVESLRDWSNGGNGAAVENLLRILTDPNTTARQQLRASNVLLSYKTDARVGAFVKGFLEAVVGDASILTDYRVEAAEQLRKLEGVPRIMSAIERPDPAPAPEVDPAAEEAARRATYEKRKRHLEEQSIKDQAALKEEWARHGWRWPDDQPA